jgi:hypothetical protein
VLIVVLPFLNNPTANRIEMESGQPGKKLTFILALSYSVVQRDGLEAWNHQEESQKSEYRRNIPSVARDYYHTFNCQYCLDSKSRTINAEADLTSQAPVSFDSSLMNGNG